jgi:hypothetical protein
VLVHGDQGAKGFRGQALEQDGVGRAVAFEHLERHQILDLLQGFASRQELGFDLFLALAEGQGLGLGEEVGQQFRVVVTDGLWLMAGARKSQGISLVPWWISW